MLRKTLLIVAGGLTLTAAAFVTKALSSAKRMNVQIAAELAVIVLALSAAILVLAQPVPGVDTQATVQRPVDGVPGGQQSPGRDNPR